MLQETMVESLTNVNISNVNINIKKVSVIVLKCENYIQIHFL